MEGKRFKVRIPIKDLSCANSFWHNRAEDLTMGAIFNSKERTVSEWSALFKDADPRFVLKGVIEPKGSALGILEVVWSGIE